MKSFSYLKRRKSKRTIIYVSNVKQKKALDSYNPALLNRCRKYKKNLAQNTFHRKYSINIRRTENIP